MAFGETVEDDLVAYRLQYQQFPLLAPGGLCLSVCVPDTSGSAQRFAPQTRNAVLLLSDAWCDSCRAMVVDEALASIPRERCHNTVQQLGSKGFFRLRCCCGLAGPQLPWGTSSNRCPAQTATGPMVTAGTPDANTVRSAGLYGVSPMGSAARSWQAVVHAATPQVVKSGLAASAARRPPSCGFRFDFSGTRRFSAPGATWSGQVISPPPGPSGGPSKTHLLPGGGVPRLHRARSPIPSRLPRFATPQSVHQFAAVAEGAYPPRRPPNVLSPGAPAPLGPCYRLVASGTPLGWRGGCLA